MATLWLRTVERFQAGYIAQLERSIVTEAAICAASYVIDWCRAHPVEGRLLLLYRVEDLVDGSLPDSVLGRARAARAALHSAFGRLGARVWPGRDADQVLLRFALVDIPSAAVRGPLRRNEPIPEQLNRLVATAVLSLLPPNGPGSPDALSGAGGAI